jgi:hypothetical protein
MPHDDIIQRLTAYDEATMDTVVSTSVGRVVLRLCDTYSPALTRQLTAPGAAVGASQDIHDAYEAWKREIQALTVHEWLYPENMYTDFHPPSAALTREVEGQLEELLAFVCGRAEEGVGELDRVSVALPDSADRRKLITEGYTLPLKLVLPLVWRAIHDSERYKAHFSQAASPLQAAKDDLPNRKLSFFRCLQRIKAGVCHHGVRNELVLLLNKTYEGVDIIEDAQALVEEKYLSDIHAAFKEQYERSNAQFKETALKHLLTWMQTNNPSALIAHLKIAEEVHAGLIKTFRYSGLDPNTDKIADSKL